MKKLFVLPLLGLIALSSCGESAKTFEGLQSSSNNSKIAQLARNEFVSYEVPVLTYQYAQGDEYVYTGEYHDSDKLQLNYFTFSGSLKGLTAMKVEYVDKYSVLLTVEGTITSKNATEGYIIVSLKAFEKVPDKYKNFTSYICKVKIGDESGEVDR